MVIAPAANTSTLTTEWGVFRSSLLSGSRRPGDFNLFGVGQHPGHFGGVIHDHVRLFPGWSAFDVAEDPNSGGTARLIGGWSPFTQGGPPPPGPVFSGLAAQLTGATGSSASVSDSRSTCPAVPVGCPDRRDLRSSAGEVLQLLPSEAGRCYFADADRPERRPALAAGDRGSAA